jgi:hypothetical protein
VQVRKISQAALVAVTAGGLASAGFGIAFAGGHSATATGGNSASALSQQNTAQAHRQNTNCDNPNFDIDVLGGRAERLCANGDGSFNMDTWVKEGGAHATGGSGGSQAVQQNTAQKGRQNNNCANPNFSGIALSDGRAGNACVNKDESFNRGTKVKGGGADVTGGSSTTAFAEQQNTAQEGRQNNNCANPNLSGIALTDGRAGNACVNKDESFNRRTKVKGGGADVTGGSSTAGDVVQQNTAQEGRQNNNCANPNGADITLTGAPARNQCTTVDRSANVGTADTSGGAQADGGSGVVDLFQQNTAQDGRQNNNCGNPNGLHLTTFGSGTRTQCVAVDSSRNIGSVHR